VSATTIWPHAIRKSDPEGLACRISTLRKGTAMTIHELKSWGVMMITAIVLASAFMVAAGLAGEATPAQAAPLRAAQITHVAVAAPCAGQGSCQYCGTGGIGTGNCTWTKLEFNVGWCGRNKAHLSSYNKAKCTAEAGYLRYGKPDQILPWINAICAPPNFRTIYLVVKGIVKETGWVGVACAGIGVYAGLQSLMVKLT
jgi:hypothetical protein